MPKKKAVKAKTARAKRKTTTKKVVKVAKKKPTTKLPRPIVVAVLGHVDHGKTSLLDVIRGTKVQEGEAGGITQSVRAHKVKAKDGNEITFIDTPGHEAFSDMRSRGASVTDIVLLVVAADDGVQPQTKQSIKFAKKSKVPIIVAANKTDLPGADVSKVKKELSQNDVLVEEYGGDVLFVPVSAKKKEGLDELLENIILLAEILELKSVKPRGSLAEGVVLESTLDKNLGPVALTLIKKGEVSIGNFVSYDGGHSKIRGLLDEFQKNEEIANVSDPVWITGLREVLETGEKLKFFDNEEEAKENSVGALRAMPVQEEGLDEKDDNVEEQDGSEDEEPEDKYDTGLLAGLLAQDEEEGEKKKLNVVIKTDAQGTLDAVLQELEKLSGDEVEINVLSKSTGAITEKDIITAKSARGIILGFRVPLSKELETMAKRERVLVRSYEIIYEMIEEVDAAMSGLLEPEEEEVEVARAKVKKVFELTNGDIVAGSEVTKGKMLKGYRVFVERGEERIGEGKITSLKRNKEEVREVEKGSECGILIEPKIEVEKGDQVVAFKVEKV
ncbi:MAG TPA: translation initiation factor IF-2 [bacterium]|nr:translation initiation factor IF-2 [bacterium]